MGDLVRQLKSLNLHHTAAGLDDLIDRATRMRLSPRQLLEVLVAEVRRRPQPSQPGAPHRPRSTGGFKPMSDYDWNWPRVVDRELVESVLRLEFLAEPRRNALLAAAQGLGKTMIAQNVAHRAILAGHSVLFTTAARMLADLGSVHGTPHLFQQRLRKYTRGELLVCDEVGYLSYDSRAADRCSRWWPSGTRSAPSC